MSLIGWARRAAGSLAFRAVVTVALIALIASRLDWPAVLDRLRGGEPVYGLLAVLLVMVALGVGAVRWGGLLRAADVPLPLRELLRIYAVTSFANAFLPTSVGGDVARPLMVSRRGPTLVRAITTVLVERLAALLALVALAWAGAAVVPEVVSSTALGALSVVSAGILAVLVAVAFRGALLKRAATALIPARFSAHLGEAATVVVALRRSPALLVAVFAQSLVFQCLVTMQIVLLAKMIGVELSFALAALALALVTIATLFPVSIGGFGVREGSYVVILGGGGVGDTDAVLISLLSVVALFVATLPGAIELARGGLKPALAEPRS